MKKKSSLTVSLYIVFQKENKKKNLKNRDGHLILSLKTDFQFKKHKILLILHLYLI